MRRDSIRPGAGASIPAMRQPDTTVGHGPGFLCSDPWEELGEDVGRKDSWLLNYIDILTLFLALLVVLLVLRPSGETVEAETNTPNHHSSESMLPSQAPPPPLETLDLADVPPIDLETGPDLEDQATAMLEDSVSDETDALPRLIDSAEHVSPPLLEDQQIVESQPSVVPDRPADSADPDVAESGAQPEVIAPQEADGGTVSPVPFTGLDPEQRFIARLEDNNLDDRLKVTQMRGGVHLEVSDNILFAQGSAELKSEGALLLDELALILLDQNGVISVEGHTDNRPISSHRFPSNWELSSGRATTVTRYLIAKGLNPVRLRAVGYGDTRPLESNETPEGQARNRRVALVVALSEGR